MVKRELSDGDSGSAAKPSLDESSSAAKLAEENSAIVPVPVPESPYPLADALFEAIGSQLDAGEKERELYRELAESLWTGAPGMPPGLPVSNPNAGKARLDATMRKALEVRKHYRRIAYDIGDLPDQDLQAVLEG